MTSSYDLDKLRKISHRQAAAAAEAKRRIERIMTHPYLDGASRQELARKEADAAKARLHEVQAGAAASLAAIQARAQKFATPATPEARAKVEKMLSSGWTLHDALQQLVKEKDRASITAMKEYLPYAARAGKLDGPAKDYDKQVKLAQETIAQYESKMWDAREQAVQNELQEAAISQPLMDHNQQKIEEWIDRAIVHPANLQLPIGIHGGGAVPGRVEGIWRWQGLPTSNPAHDPTVKQGIASIETLLAEGE